MNNNYICIPAIQNVTEHFDELTDGCPKGSLGTPTSRFANQNDNQCYDVLTMSPLENGKCPPCKVIYNGLNLCID